MKEETLPPFCAFLPRVRVHLSPCLYQNNWWLMSGSACWKETRCLFVFFIRETHIICLTITLSTNFFIVRNKKCHLSCWNMKNVGSYEIFNASRANWMSYFRIFEPWTYTLMMSREREWMYEALFCKTTIKTTTIQLIWCLQNVLNVVFIRFCWWFLWTFFKTFRCRVSGNDNSPPK